MLNFNVPPTKASVSEPQWKVGKIKHKTWRLPIVFHLHVDHLTSVCFLQVLVYDKWGQDIISPLLSVRELRDMGVTLHLWVITNCFDFIQISHTWLWWSMINDMSNALCINFHFTKVVEHWQRANSGCPCYLFCHAHRGQCEQDLQGKLFSVYKFRKDFHYLLWIYSLCFQDLQNQLYESYYFNFISAISRQKLEDLALAAIQTNSVTQVSKVRGVTLTI